MKKIIGFQDIKVLFSVSYAVIAGMCVEFMCRYLFFSYTRKDMALPLVVDKLLLEEVPAPYFPEDYTYLQMALIPAALLVGLFLWSKISPGVIHAVNIAITLCNMTVTLFFLTYATVFFYCIYLFSVPEILDPPTCSSRASIVVKYIFMASCLPGISSLICSVGKTCCHFRRRNTEEVGER